MSLTNQLMLFIDVAQQGSFTKAAALNDMDNSALSKQIKKLENDLNVQLLNRSTRSFSLTSVGEEILKQAMQLKDTLNTIQLTADSYQSKPQGMLRITSPHYFGQAYLQPVISNFMRRYPDVQIVHSLTDKKSDIISDNFDVAFRLGKLSDSNLIAKVIANTHFVLVASDSFIEQYGGPKTPQELIKLPAIVYSNDDLTLDQLRINDAVGSNQSTTYKMTGNYKVSDVRTLLDAVKDGLGYALVDLSNITKPLSELNLNQLLSDHNISTMDMAIYAIYPHKKYTRLAKEFINAVQAYIGEPPRWQSHL